MIYLDNAATTEVAPEVIEEMISYLKSNYGNPSSKYYEQAENAKKYLEKSREKIAQFIKVDSDEIIFTSGSTESNNFVLKGLYDINDKNNHIITSKVEHKSVLKTCEYLEKNGCRVTYLNVNKYGQIDLGQLEEAITDETFLVSIIWANNELGSLNQILEISQICKKNNIKFHTDATQIFGKIRIDLKDIDIDFMSFTAHKIHGPKGIGALYIKNDEIGLKPEIEPLIHGGNQEDDLRAGTQSMHNIVGFAKAIDLIDQSMSKNMSKIISLEDKMIKTLKSSFPNVIFNSNLDYKVPGIISFSIPNLQNELFLNMIKKEFAISTGSACNISEPSYVLKAIGGIDKQHNTLRVSISHYNDESILDLTNLIEKYLEKYDLD